uniref:Uncharacterized protein n=1 Tax=Rhizophora mucronata TaxID=61149 RepID=A0A2P2IHW2_RHIMU
MRIISIFQTTRFSTTSTDNCKHLHLGCDCTTTLCFLLHTMASSPLHLKVHKICFNKITLNGPGKMH